MPCVHLRYMFIICATKLLKIRVHMNASHVHTHKTAMLAQSTLLKLGSILDVHYLIVIVMY